MPTHDPHFTPLSVSRETLTGQVCDPCRTEDHEACHGHVVQRGAEWSCLCVSCNGPEKGPEPRPLGKEPSTSRCAYCGDVATRTRTWTALDPKKVETPGVWLPATCNPCLVHTKTSLDGMAKLLLALPATMKQGVTEQLEHGHDPLDMLQLLADYFLDDPEGRSDIADLFGDHDCEGCEDGTDVCPLDEVPEDVLAICRLVRERAERDEESGS